MTLGAEEAEHEPCESSPGTGMSSETVPLHREAVKVAGGKGKEVAGCLMFLVFGYLLLERVARVKPNHNKLPKLFSSIPQPVLSNLGTIQSQGHSWKECCVLG